MRAQTEQARGISIPRPSALEIEVSEKLKGRLAEIREGADALTRDLPVERTPEQQAIWVLAQLLEWHRREEKIAWWEFFRLNDEDADWLVDEDDGLGHLAFQKRISRTARVSWSTGTPFGAGLFYVPMAHEGYQNECVEEADRVAALVTELTVPGVTWTDCEKKMKQLTLADILIVAPYNAQVGAISERPPGARVGTVDKFQGQEAPVVIYSTTTSSAEEAPHGMEFLFSRNRLNVATSRAKCVCILVGNLKLFEPECRTPQQMRLANSFCRYLELARSPQPTANHGAFNAL